VFTEEDDAFVIFSKLIFQVPEKKWMTRGVDTLLGKHEKLVLVIDSQKPRGNSASKELHGFLVKKMHCSDV